MEFVIPCLVIFFESCSNMAGSCCERITDRGISSLWVLTVKCHDFILMRSSNVNSKYNRPSVHTFMKNRYNNYKFETTFLFSCIPSCTKVFHGALPWYTAHILVKYWCCGRTLLCVSYCSTIPLHRLRRYFGSTSVLTSYLLLQKKTKQNFLNNQPLKEVLIS